MKITAVMQRPKNLPCELVWRLSKCKNNCLEPIIPMSTFFSNTLRVVRVIAARIITSPPRTTTTAAAVSTLLCWRRHGAVPPVSFLGITTRRRRPPPPPRIIILIKDVNCIRPRLVICRLIWIFPFIMRTPFHHRWSTMPTRWKQAR